MRQDIAGLDNPTGGDSLRLAAQAIQGAALQLLGHAERLQATGAETQAIGSIAGMLLSLADDLRDNTDHRRAADLVIEPEHVAVGPLVRHAAASVSAMLWGRRQWRVAPALEGLALRADRRALTQVFSRVFSNAARFSQHDDWIDVDLRLTADSAIVVVQDEGNQPAIGAGLSSDRRGLGFGLRLSRRLMEAHGGSLAVATVQGVGSCVTLRFPRALVIDPPRVADPPALVEGSVMASSHA